MLPALGSSAQQAWGFCAIYNVVWLSWFWPQTWLSFFLWADYILEHSSFKILSVTVMYLEQKAVLKYEDFLKYVLEFFHCKPQKWPLEFAHREPGS